VGPSNIKFKQPTVSTKGAGEAAACGRGTDPEGWTHTRTSKGDQHTLPLLEKDAGG